MEASSAQGTIKIFDVETCLDLEGVTMFSSIRANTAVFSGKYQYEVRIMNDGLM